MRNFTLAFDYMLHISLSLIIAHFCLIICSTFLCHFDTLPFFVYYIIYNLWGPHSACQMTLLPANIIFEM